MPHADYAHVSLPRELWKSVLALPLRELGYRTPTEFVKEAIREHIERKTPRLPEQSRPKGRSR